MQKVNKKTVIIILIIIFIGLAYYMYNTNKEEQIQNLEITNEIVKNDVVKQEASVMIKIHIAGAVSKEGLFELKEENRIADAIDLAGGLKGDADISNINLASKLEDGMKIYIPTIDETQNNKVNNEVTYDKNISVSNGTSNSKNAKVNINSATQSELETLPGIGSATALKIINYRKENGKFSSIEDIKKVKGIGNNKYENIKDLITI